MSTKLEEMLVKIPCREHGGAVASNRFDFQKNWALCELIRLHEGNQDYVLVLEHHEDVITLNACSEPDAICFYQVKTKKTGNWTSKALLTRKNTSGSVQPSILGKLYSSYKEFQSATESMNVVSNATFKCELADASKDSEKLICIPVKDLSQKEIDLIEKLLKEEHGLPTSPKVANVTYYLVSDLPYDKHSEVAQARLADLIEGTAPSCSYRIKTAYQAVFDTIRMKTNVEKQPSSYAELVKTKGISRAQFQSMISSIVSGRDHQQLWSDIQGRLNTEGMPFAEVEAIREQWTNLHFERLHWGEHFERLYGQAKAQVEKNRVIGFLPRLTDTLNAITIEIVGSKVNLHPYDERFLKALVVFLIYENK